MFAKTRVWYENRFIVHSYNRYGYEMKTGRYV